MFRVIVEFKPENPDDDSTKQVFNFIGKDAAQNFQRQQARRPNVLKSHYMGKVDEK